MSLWSWGLRLLWSGHYFRCGFRQLSDGVRVPEFQELGKLFMMLLE